MHVCVRARKEHEEKKLNQIARPAVCIRWCRKCTIMLFVQYCSMNLLVEKFEKDSEREQKKNKEGCDSIDHINV